MPASEDEQGRDIKEPAKRFNDAPGQAQERGEQRDAPTCRLEQIVKQTCDSNLAGHFDEVHGETPLKQALVRQDVGRGGRSVALNDKPGADEALGEYSCEYSQQINSACNPRLKTRRRINTLHHRPILVSPISARDRCVQLQLS